MSDRETISAYDEQAGVYANCFKRQKLAPALLAFMKQVIPGGLVLDLGCGPAQTSAELRDQGFAVDPVDASREMVRLANETYDIGARIANFDQIEAITHYDGVWANFSLLHASKEAFPRHLLAIYQSLKPGGSFHIGMKRGAGTRRDRFGRIYSYYSIDELTGLLTHAGFEIGDHTLGEEAGMAGNVEPWVIVLSKKAID